MVINHHLLRWSSKYTPQDLTAFHIIHWSFGSDHFSFSFPNIGWFEVMMAVASSRSSSSCVFNSPPRKNGIRRGHDGRGAHTPEAVVLTMRQFTLHAFATWMMAGSWCLDVEVWETHQEKNSIPFFYRHMCVDISKKGTYIHICI